MLNQKTREVLGALGAINQSQIISYPVTVVKMGKSIQAFLDVSSEAENGCQEEEFDEFGVYVINELNSVINVIDDPEIALDNRILTIKNDNSSVQYGTTQLEVIESEARGNPQVIDNVMNPERNTKVLSFNLNNKELDRIKKMSGLLKNLSDLKIEAKDGEVTLTVTAKERSSNNFSVTIDGEVGEELTMLLLMDSINKLPSSDYKVHIFKSSKGSLVAVFESEDVDGLRILVSSKA
jgi:hypothetical protein